LSSYLFLVIVNPGLLLYDVKFPVANRTPVDEIPIKGCSATFTYAGGLSLAENVLDEMTQVAVTTDAKGNKKSRYAVEMEEKDGKLQPKLDKKGLPITLVDDDGYPVPILAAEEPFYDTYDFLVQAVSITQAIQKETQKCVCGNTLYNIDLTSGGCKPGMAKDEAEAFIKANKTSKLTNQAECLTRCDSCLDKTTKASEGCNLALLVELRTKLQTLLGGAEELKPPFADPPTPVPDTAVPLVKNIRQQTSKFALTRLDFLRKTLENNASEFYIRNAEGSFETDFRSQQQDLIAQGCEVKIETPDFLQSATPDKQIPLQAYQDSQDKKSLASFGKWAGYWKTFLNLALGQGKPVQAQNPKKYFDQTGYYAISDGTGLGGIIPSATIQHNREVERTASNANFTAVILQMSLSELQGIFQRCLSSAFKTGGFKVTVEEMETIVKMAMQSIDTNIIGTIMGNSKALAALMGDTIQKENETAFGEAWVSEVNFCEKKCVLNYVLGKSPVLTEAQDNLGLQDLLNNLGVSLSNTA
ncbi:MAG: hypothetical protein NTV62_04185, partial [Candidatus Gribaldobacteria bacterium]|nr:hypothetical protein [Candidatus Gribaldobacteria bacterium]